MASSAPLQSPSSSRSSLSADRNIPATQRRNKVALRDYYHLAEAASEPKVLSSDFVTAQTEDIGQQSHFDNNHFDENAYVAGLLDSDGMHEILRVESGLISDIRGIDGERKALVYDNYSKLIAATDTIKRMRGSMDPLAPTTETLKPAVGRIEGMSADIAADLRSRLDGRKGFAPGERERLDSKTQHPSPQQDLVRWVLDSPRRLERMMREEKQEEARKAFAEITQLLDKWHGVPGVEEMRRRTQAAMES
ncbi:MAG: hypothetical protein M1828_007585 [Chrysothrix sp. TS-e1954]|nr:MAG: hypothetical protein M1828_007585 [Chrysothrix sp. TS-e1954]